MEEKGEKEENSFCDSVGNSHSNTLLNPSVKSRISRSSTVVDDKSSRLVSFKNSFTSEKNLFLSQTIRPKRKATRLTRNQSVLSFQGIVSLSATYLFKLDNISSPVNSMSLVGNTSIWMGTDRGSILIWDKNTIQLLRTIQFHSGAITCLIPVGENIWVGSVDGMISIWNTINLKQVKCVKFRSPVRCMKYICNLIWIGTDNRLYCYSSNIIKQKKLKVKHGVKTIQYITRTNEVWIGQNSGDIGVLNSAGQLIIKKIINAHSNKVNCITECFGNVWSGSNDCTMKVWSSKSYECIKELDIQAPVRTFASDQNSIWGISNKEKLNMWDGKTLRMEYEVSRRVQTGGMICIAIFPVIDNGKVISKNLWLSSGDNSISVWKILSSSAFKEIKE